MSDTVVIQAVEIFAQLIKAALDGNKPAQKRLAGILPRKLHTRLVRDAQRRLDERKFSTR